MKRKTCYKIMNRVSIIMGVIGFMFMIWMLISVFEVANNTGTHNNIQQYNMFVLYKQAGQDD